MITIPAGSTRLQTLGLGIPSRGKLLQKCQGDCDEDAHCATGLKCFQRNNGEKVPGCLAGGEGDIAHYDYCVYNNITGAQCDEVLPPTPNSVSYAERPYSHP